MLLLHEISDITGYGLVFGHDARIILDFGWDSNLNLESGT